MVIGAMSQPRVRKMREEVEQKYIAEWVAKNFPNAIKIWYQKGLGDLPHRLAMRTQLSPEWYARYAKRADAVVITESEVVVVEAETRRAIIGLSELIVYRDLLPYTPDLRPYLVGRKTRLILVTPLPDADVIKQCQIMGIEYQIYFPEWLEEHLKRWGVLPESGGR
jgi:hypothetical protein